MAEEDKRLKMVNRLSKIASIKKIAAKTEKASVEEVRTAEG